MTMEEVEQNSRTRVSVEVFPVAYAERFHAGIAGGIIQETEASGNRGMSFSQPAGEKGRSLGYWTDGGEDGGMPVAEAGAVGQFEFVEWTGENHLRHTKFIALRDDKKAKDVKRE
jgi:hypothetical protein